VSLLKFLKEVGEFWSVPSCRHMDGKTFAVKKWKPFHFPVCCYAGRTATRSAMTRTDILVAGAQRDSYPQAGAAARGLAGAYLASRPWRELPVRLFAGSHDASDRSSPRAPDDEPWKRRRSAVPWRTSAHASRTGHGRMRRARFSRISRSLVPSRLCPLGPPWRLAERKWMGAVPTSPPRLFILSGAAHHQPVRVLLFYVVLKHTIRLHFLRWLSTKRRGRPIRNCMEWLLPEKCSWNNLNLDWVYISCTEGGASYKRTLGIGRKKIRFADDCPHLSLA
jgi:hypothetical protein